MKIGIFGTGIVGSTIGSKLVSLGHQVMMGSRTIDNKKANEWVKANGIHASQGKFSEAASFGEIIFNCTSGFGALESIGSAGEANLNGKILIDISNPLDFSKGMPPSLFVCNTDSLGEQIQNKFPYLKVVKTLNTVNCNVMVNPSLVPGEHDLFMCGNDEIAKEKVNEILKNWFGWKTVIDLGDITNARATEMILPLWVRLYGKFQSPNFNFRIVK
ncbi:MAG: NADP oxidoreductase [Melioribacter sp.]|nr:NADP oxidoreductase [Melioribacter sp.]